MKHFKLNFNSNIPKSYLPIVLLKRLEISINNPTLHPSVTHKKLLTSSTKKDDRIKRKRVKKNKKQLNDYYFEEDDIISTCYNLEEADLQEHDTQSLSIDNVSIECESFHNNDSANFTENWEAVNSNNHTTQAEVSSSELFADEQIKVEIPQIDCFSDLEDNKVPADDLLIDVEGLSQSDEENNIMEIEDPNNNLFSNELVKEFDSTGELLSNELPEEYQPPQSTETIKKCINQNNASKFISNFSQFKKRVRNINEKRPRTKSKCPQCNYMSATNLIRHMAKHSTDRPYKCDVCGYASKTKCNLQRHIIAHRGEKNFVCTICPYRSATSTSWRIHMHTHTGLRPYKCNQCSYAGRSAASLCNHLRTHSDLRPFRCSQCPYAGKSASALHVHKRTHSELRRYKCGQCQYAAKTTCNLKRHLFLHTREKPYKCSKCQYASSVMGNLKRHSRTHLIEKPFKCSCCLFRSTSLRNLKVHFRVHKNKDSVDTKEAQMEGRNESASSVVENTQSEIVGSPKVQSQKQLYVCYDCDKSFLIKAMLEKHWKSRHYPQFQKVKNYNCQHCGKVLTSCGAFVRHHQLFHKIKNFLKNKV